MASTRSESQSLQCPASPTDLKQLAEIQATTLIGFMKKGQISQDVLRTDPTKMKAMLADHTASTHPNIIKDLNPYHFKGAEVDHILEQYGNILSQEPASYEEHFAHYHYAFSATLLYNEHKIAPYFRKWRGYKAIFDRRLGQLREGLVQELYPEAVVAPSPTVPVPVPAQNMTALPKNTVLTKTQVNNFLGDPFTLVDHVFVLQPGTEEALQWKVITFTMKENREMEYGVQFTDCDCSLPMKRDEIISLMMESGQVNQ